jgi:drug/metabolite transporter (DMT)-like permease
LCIVSTALTGASILFIKHGLTFENSFWLFMFIAQMCGTLTSAFLYTKKHSFLPSRMHITKHDIAVGLMVGSVGFISCYTLMAALQYSYVSLVYTIHAHYILIPIFLSVWWYGEHMNLRKFAAVVLSCVTLMLLY